MPIANATLAKWSLKTYTNSTWTDLATGSAGGDAVKGINIANVSGSAIDVSVRVTDSGGTALATILPLVSIAAGVGQKLDIDTLNLVSSGKLQIYATAAGLEFYASGATFS